MKGITVRFADDLHAVISEEAEHVGINLTSYMREAALARALITRAQRGYYTGSEELDAAIRHYLSEGRKPKN